MSIEDHILRAHQRVTHAEQTATTARRERDDLIREAIASGTSAYRIAKLLGIQQSAVARIRRAG